MKRLSDAYVLEVVEPPAPRVVASARVPDLDAARGTMMLLGLVIHSANIYMLQHWRINDPDAHFSFDWINAFIHSFRMETFFWIAGYFAAMALARRPPAHYLSYRMPQLLIPTLVTVLTFNLAEALIERHWPTPNAQVASSTALLVNHLWFLVDLTVFTVLAVAWCSLRRTRMDLPAWVSGLRQSPFKLLTVLTLASSVPPLALMAASRWLGVDLSISLFGATDTNRLLGYLPFFAFGMLVHGDPGFRRVFESIHPAWLVPSIAADIVLNLYAAAEFSWSLMHILSTFLTWLTVGAMLSLFKRVFVRETRVSRWLADASYPMYLAHMLPIAVLGTALTHTNWPVACKFALVLVGSLAFSACFALLVGRSRVLSWLFTGRQLRQAPEVPAKGRAIRGAWPTSV